MKSRLLNFVFGGVIALPSFLNAQSISPLEEGVGQFSMTFHYYPYSSKRATIVGVKDSDIKVRGEITDDGSLKILSFGSDFSNTYPEGSGSSGGWILSEIIGLRGAKGDVRLFAINKKMGNVLQFTRKDDTELQWTRAKLLGGDNLSNLKGHLNKDGNIELFALQTGKLLFIGERTNTEDGRKELQWYRKWTEVLKNENGDIIDYDVVRNANGRLEIFAATNKGLFHTVQPWKEWKEIRKNQSGESIQKIKAIRHPKHYNRIEVFALANWSNNADAQPFLLWHTYQLENGEWRHKDGWESPEPPKFHPKPLLDFDVGFNLDNELIVLQNDKKPQAPKEGFGLGGGGFGLGLGKD